MEKCDYTRLYLDMGIEIHEYEKNNWKPFMRQCLITSGVCCLYFMQGLFLGTPTVLIAQMRRDPNATEIITDEKLSWLTSTPAVSSVPFVVILPLLLNRIGRKRTFLLIWLVELIGFVILYNSTKTYQILISEACAGPTFASTITISPVIIAEYTSPKYRGVFLNLKGATAFWGVWISNAIGTFFPWKNIALASFVCSVYIISMLAWPESPYWLAKKGRYAECAKAHRWLKGVNENSEKELAQLIISQKNLNNSNAAQASNNQDFCNYQAIVTKLSNMWSILILRPFYKPVVISIILIAQFYLSGKMVITMYAIEVLQHLMPDQSFVYKAMLILDGVTVFSMYVGCIVSRYFKRRTLLMLFSGTGILVLYILALYMYLASISVIVENDIVVLFFLTVFSIAIGCGPMILCTSIYGEIISPRYQNPAMILVGVGGVTTMSLLLKVSPLMFRNFKIQGSFLFYAISSTILLGIIYFYLPETKNKTIQEIEQFFTKSPVVIENNRTTEDREGESNSLI